MAEGQEAIDFHQLYYKKPRIWPLDPSHCMQKVQRLSKMPTWQYFLMKATDSRRNFGSDMNGTRIMVKRSSIFFHKNKNRKLTRSWPLDWRDCFGHEIKWDAPSSFGLWAWLLEASQYGRPSRKVVRVHGQNFGI